MTSTPIDSASRGALVGRFAAAVAHELNNPLSFILMNLESLRVEVSPRNGACTATELIDQTLCGVRRISRVVADLVALADTSEVPAKEVVGVGEVIALCLSDLRRDHLHTVEVRLADDPLCRALLARASFKDAVDRVLEFLLAPHRRRRGVGAEIVLCCGRELGQPCLVISDSTIELTSVEIATLFEPKLAIDSFTGSSVRLDLSLALACQMLHTSGAKPIALPGCEGGLEIKILLTPP